MDMHTFDQEGRFVLPNYTESSPFASFLPGIAGTLGIPMWVFYTNRGQGIAGFGVAGKDAPIMEFQPANKAYQTVGYTGFRTFIHLDGEALYEPFSQLAPPPCPPRQMCVGMNMLELQEVSAQHGLQTTVTYFTLTGEPFAGLVRQVTVKNMGGAPVSLRLLDGLPAIIPYGVNNWLLKEMSRTLEAWMEVFNLDANIPFYRVRASVIDSAEVEGIRAGHFYLAFVDDNTPLSPIVDPAHVFGGNTSFSYPEAFMQNTPTGAQVPVGKTPCGFFGTARTLSPGESLTLHSIIGHVSAVEVINHAQQRIASAAYLAQKQQEAAALTHELTQVVAVKTGSPLFDAYTRQTFLDNVMRGGWPLVFGADNVYHVYSRKHGDMERDYNAFYLAPEYYSQGNGSYRDVNQNRREDVWLNPGIKAFNIRMFMNLLQADGYNPLSIQGSRFVIPENRFGTFLPLVENPEKLLQFFLKPFTPGALMVHLQKSGVVLTVTAQEFVETVLAHAEQHIEATFGEGYWIDHWTYNLDLIENYLAIYPDKKDDLLFNHAVYTFYDSAMRVVPRSEKYVLTENGPRQFGAVQEDPEKVAMIAARKHAPNVVRVQEGHGEIYRTTLFAKLVTLALVKFATSDPYGMGIEMEAGRPGWYDAVNGLPGLFGASLPETVELLRLVNFLRGAIAEKGSEHTLSLPVEVDVLLQQVIRALNAYIRSELSNRDFVYWDTVSAARETFRKHTREGFYGQEIFIAMDELDGLLNLFAGKLQAGIDRATALNDGLLPTYLTYTVEAYTLTGTADAQGRPHLRAMGFTMQVLPLFLEAPTRLLKTLRGDDARALYRKLRESALFDRALKMYRLNDSLENQPFDIGRARAFPPGWLENGSIWLHMAYKTLLATLDAGLYDEFYDDFKTGLVAFQDPAVYGRSPLENSSFIVSSAHPDPALHGRGFVARLSGATAEFLSILHRMMAGSRPFLCGDGTLKLRFCPALPGWLFDDDGDLSFTFLGGCTVTYHNPERRDTFGDNAALVQRMTVRRVVGEEDAVTETVEVDDDTLKAPYAEEVRDGRVSHIEVWLG